MFEHFYFIYKGEPYQVLPLQVKVDCGIMAIKGYFKFPQAPGNKPHN